MLTDAPLKLDINDPRFTNLSDAVRRLLDVIDESEPSCMGPEGFLIEKRAWWLRKTWNDFVSASFLSKENV